MTDSELIEFCSIPRSGAELTQFRPQISRLVEANLLLDFGNFFPKKKGWARCRRFELSIFRRRLQ